MSSAHLLQTPKIKVALFWCTLLGVVAAGHWSLIAFDPQAGIFRPAEGLEGILFEPTGQAPLPILGLVLWMVWRRRVHLTGRVETGGISRVLDVICFLAAFAIAAWATHVAAPDLLVFSLQFVLLGLGGTLGGSRGRRAMLLPAFALLFAIPIPPVLLNRLIFGLQVWTATTCSAIAELFGQSAEVFGTDIVTSRGVFRVIESCTGITMISTLFLATILLSELSDRTALRCVALLVCVPLVGPVVNILRVLTIMGNPYSELAGVHSGQGMIMMVVGVLIVAGIDVVFARLVPAARAYPESIPARDFRLDRRFAGVLTASAVLAMVVFVTPTFERSEDEESLTLSSTVPIVLFGQRSNGLQTDTEFLGSVSFSDRIDRGYGDGVEQVRVFVGENDHSNRRISILSEKTGYPGSGWQRMRLETVEIEPGVEAELSILVSKEGMRQALHWREDVGGFWTESIRNFVGLDQSAFGARNARSRVFRVGADLPAGTLDRREQLISYAHAIRTSPGSTPSSDLTSANVSSRTEERLGQ